MSELTRRIESLMGRNMSSLSSSVRYDMRILMSDIIKELEMKDVEIVSLKEKVNSAEQRIIELENSKQTTIIATPVIVNDEVRAVAEEKVEPIKEEVKVEEKLEVKEEIKVEDAKQEETKET